MRSSSPAACSMVRPGRRRAIDWRSELRRDAARAGASLVLLSSVSALVGQAGNVAYCASKGAVLAATRALAVELMRDNIRVNAVLPALVETEMAERFRATMTEAQWQGYVAQYPMGIGRP